MLPLIADWPSRPHEADDVTLYAFHDVLFYHRCHGYYACFATDADAMTRAQRSGTPPAPCALRSACRLMRAAIRHAYDYVALSAPFALMTFAALILMR